jgi:hypothetical protein
MWDQVSVAEHENRGIAKTYFSSVLRLHVKEPRRTIPLIPPSGVRFVMKERVNCPTATNGRFETEKLSFGIPIAECRTGKILPHFVQILNFIPIVNLYNFVGHDCEPTFR